jgi:D-psicose/D-tagatose/L-ribulose 3-epimerase
MKFGTLFAYWVREWKGDYSRFARKVAKIGFDILEVSAGQLLEMSKKELDELRSLTRDLGISVTSNIGPPKDKDVSSKNPAVRKEGIRNLTEIMHAMDRLDSRLLAGVLHSYWPCDFLDVDKPAAWELGVESVRELSKTAEELGIDLCIEVVNRFESYILNTSEEAVRYCRAVDSRRVGVLLDTFHMNIEEDNMGDAIRLAGPFLGHLHVGENNRKVPGKGHMPWNEIGKALRDIHYDKGVVMEPFVLSGGRVGNDIKVWRDLSEGADEAAMDGEIGRSLEFLKAAFRG